MLKFVNNKATQRARFRGERDKEGRRSKKERERGKRRPRGTGTEREREREQCPFRPLIGSVDKFGEGDSS